MATEAQHREADAAVQLVIAQRFRDVVNVVVKAMEEGNEPEPIDVAKLQQYNMLVGCMFDAFSMHNRG